MADGNIGRGKAMIYPISTSTGTKEKFVVHRVKRVVPGKMEKILMETPSFI
jgi:hypothetical protein